MIKVKIDMTGWVMAEHGVPNSRLTVIEQAEDYVNPSGKHYSQWLCECSCENHTRKIIKGSHIKDGRILSCGCVQHETMVRNGINSLNTPPQKSNRYSEKMIDEYGEYYLIYSNPDEKVCGMIDADRLDDVKQYSWSLSGGGYLSTSINGKYIKMHQLLFGKWYDHIDRNKLNNRRYNLRPCNAKQNLANSSKHRDGDNKYKGVYFDKRKGKYYAQLAETINGKRKRYTGALRSNIEEALKDRLQMEAEHQGEFSAQIDLFEQYGIEIPKIKIE